MIRASKRKFPEAKGSPNNGERLVLIVRTRSVREAYEMLRAGNPIDQAVGYYVEHGMLEKDLFMMDQVEKLHALSKFRDLKNQAQLNFNALAKQFQEEEAASAKAAAMEVTNKITDNEQKTEVPK